MVFLVIIALFLCLLERLLSCRSNPTALADVKIRKDLLGSSAADVLIPVVVIAIDPLTVVFVG